MGLTITEALAEIKTIGKRLEKKREYILNNLARHDTVKDPMEKDGGSAAVLVRERQAVADLEKRVIDLRAGIQTANTQTTVSINGTAKPISDWLTWRRDVAPKQKEFLGKLRGALNSIRETAKKQGVALVGPGGTPSLPTDIIVNIDEAALAKETEDMEDILGQLDGQLSLKNATVIIREDAAPTAA